MVVDIEKKQFLASIMLSSTEFCNKVIESKLFQESKTPKQIESHLLISRLSNA